MYFGFQGFLLSPVSRHPIRMRLCSTLLDMSFNKLAKNFKVVVALALLFILGSCMGTENAVEFDTDNNLTIEEPCPSILLTDINPQKVELTVGETVTPTVELLTCEGKQILDINTWTSGDEAIATVDPESGLIMARSVGQTRVEVENETYGWLGSIDITVASE